MAPPATPESRWFRRFHPRPDAEVALVCLPHAGGSASTYFSLSERLPAHIDVLAVQYPGRQNRFHEPCLDTVQDLARGTFADLESVAAGRTVALFGHSMGAAVAFELARLLEREESTAPRVLFVSGRRAPSLGTDRGARLLDDEGLVAELQGLEGTDARILEEPELLQLLLPSVRADYIASETYAPGPGTMVRCDVVALAGDEDAHVEVEEVAGWRNHTKGTFELRIFDGGHFFLADHEPEIATLVTDTVHAPAGSGHATG
ncbi:alpha/beta fold hydrolase [Streptomyces javensis]|uniref:thioesterase II family protein n=1 Tax=Streptomyces javensis TaxID=114698 RepID=UPI0033E3E642